MATYEIAVRSGVKSRPFRAVDDDGISLENTKGREETYRGGIRDTFDEILRSVEAC